MESKAKAIRKRAHTIEYLTWIAELKKRYRATQIKAAVAVNSALIEFYWNLGSRSCKTQLQQTAARRQRMPELRRIA